MAFDKYVYRRGYKGNLVDPTMYEAVYAKASSTTGHETATGPNSAYADFGQMGMSGNGALALRSRLSQQIRGAARANVALTAVGWRQSLSMIANRAGQMTRALRQLRKGNVLGMIRTLSDQGHKTPKGKTYVRKWSSKRARKEPAQAWLEANFGWAPLVSDIHSAVEVMGASLPTDKVVASARDTVLSGSIDEAVDYRPGTGPHQLYYQFKKLDWNAEVRLRAGCEAVASNPNTALLSSLGLTNPAFVAWDWVPFSFVVDWFLPVGKFLNTFDAFVGFTITRGWTTVQVKGQMMYSFENQYYWDWLPYKADNVSDFKKVTRHLGIPPIPSIGDLRPSLNPNLWQAITSLALLQNVFSTIKRKA